MIANIVCMDLMFFCSVMIFFCGIYIQKCSNGCLICCKKIKSEEVIYSITPTFFKNSLAESLSSSVSSKGTVISLHCSVK